MREHMNLSLRRGDVEVRVLHRRDAAALQALLRDNRAWLERWEATIPGVQLMSPGDASLRPVIRYQRSRMRQGHSVPCGVFVHGELVGQIGISDIAWGAVRSGQIGYWIAEAHAGKGITPVAVRLLIEYALTTLGLHRVEICLRPENDASRRVVEKLGMRYEGLRERYIHIDGAWRDHDCFALTAEELTRFTD